MDPLVEFLANRGAFGPGDFTDHSNLDVFPALAIAAIFALTVIAGLTRRAFRSQRYAPGWLRQCVSAGCDEAWPTLMPAIFAAQLTVLWTMETIEQMIVAGRPLGGVIWLGAPAPLGLAIHAAGGIILTCALARIIRWSATTIVDIVTFVLEAFRSASASFLHGSPARDRVVARFLEPFLARLSGRAPPHLIA